MNTCVPFQTRGIIESHQPNGQDHTTDGSQDSTTQDEPERCLDESKDDFDSSEKEAEAECHQGGSGLELVNPSFT